MTASTLDSLERFSELIQTTTSSRDCQGNSLLRTQSNMSKSEEARELINTLFGSLILCWISGRSFRILPTNSLWLVGNLNTSSQATYPVPSTASSTFRAGRCTSSAAKSRGFCTAAALCRRGSKS